MGKGMVLLTGALLESRIISLVIGYFGKDVDRMNHALKVYSYAKAIGGAEGIVEGPEADILATAALLHDVGIKASLEKHGTCTAKMQEDEGARLVPELLREFDLPEALVGRVAHMVGHHHTYSAVDGTDFRILVEADFLVNQHEGGGGPDDARRALEGFFRTSEGSRLLSSMYL